MKYWFPLCNHTHYSLQRAFSKPADLAQKCKDNNYKACGLADYKSISGAVSFYEECVKKDIKPIIGCDFGNFQLFAKNKNGWQELIHIISNLNSDGSFDVGLIANICKNKNFIATAISEAYSPISGEDFYLKTPLFYDTYYVEKEDAELHRVLLCSKKKKTMKNIDREDPEISQFFESSDYHVRNVTRISELVLEDSDSLEAFEEIYNKCEFYNILNKPMLPKFSTPKGKSEEEYLKDLARVGWVKMLKDQGKVSKDEDKEKYYQRFLSEMKVLEEADLFGYFLIVQDIIRYANSQGWMTGPGRGSAAGCLISYLLGITQIDPIEYDLLFERFYNSGRNTEDHISLPDIDMDVPADKRDEIIQYIKDKYGESRVSQMLTFGRLQGRSALKEILRVYDVCGFSEMNEITKAIPDEAMISDQLSQMDDDERSIIRWALINNKKELMDYCFINDSGHLEGDYAEFFEKAIQLEGTFKNQGKHAAGIVIAAEALDKVCPMVYSASGEEKVAGLEMADLEALGHVKFDLLGLSLLSKLMKIEEISDV